MLLGSGAKKILICAPSNAAVDEIITRVSERGFVGINTNDSTDCKIEEMLLRIGSMEYEPSPIVKRHTLDERTLVTLHGNKIYDLKALIEVATECLEMMNEPGFEGMKMEEKKHVTFVQRLVKQSYRDVKKWMMTKTHDQQVAMITKDLEFRKRKLNELLNNDEQKVVSISN